MASTPDNTIQEIDQLLDTEFSETMQSEGQFDVEAGYQKFLGLVADAKAEESDKRHRSRMMRLLRYAAVLLCIVGAATCGYLGEYNMVRSQLADVTMTVPHGAQSKVTLPDGTTVTLNAGSRISYSQAYGLQTRDVQLVGEGYFEVKHDTEHPFTVSTPSLIVNDIGTVFNIRDYEEDKTAEVTMESGNVNVSNAKGKTLAALQHDDRLVYDKVSGTFTKEKVTETDRVAWVQGNLLLDGESMEEVALVLERTFDVTIVFKDDSKKNLHFCGDFSYNKDKVTDILDMLSATGKMRYSVHDKIVTIY